MSTTVTQVIRKVAGDKKLNIERAEWAPLERVVKLLNGRMTIHDHETAGVFHGRSFVPVPHYLVELEAEPDQIDGIIEKIDPLIDEIIERNIFTTKVPANV